MLARTGFLHLRSSCQIRSLARAEPPGLSTRSTIALTVLSFSACRIASIIVGISTAVNEADLERVGCGVRPLVDDLLDVGGRPFLRGTALDDPGDEAVIEVVIEKALELLAIGVAHLRAHVRLGGALEIAH